MRTANGHARALRIPHLRLDGSTLDRATPVQRFQALGVTVFLISLKAGGVGLNLTAADSVIHYDLRAAANRRRGGTTDLATELVALS